MPVQLTAVATEPLPVDIALVGRCMPHQSVEIQARVVATLRERHFTEGSQVTAEQVLFSLDSTELTAQRDTILARLAQAEAALAQARIDLERVQPLAEAGAAPRAELDRARTDLLAAEADVRYSTAQLANAEQQLSYTVVHAPFAGRVGKAQRDVGATVGPQDGALATLDQIDPMAIDFALSEREFLALRRDIDAGVITSPGTDHLVVKVQLLDGTELHGEGRIGFRDVRIDPATGAAHLRAEMANPEGRLLPGQFARVRVVGMQRPAAILLPQRAVVQGPTGVSVFVVGSDDKAESRSITAGPWADGRWLIEAGVTVGERVVVDGLQGVVPGKKVTIAPAPSAESRK